MLDDRAGGNMSTLTVLGMKLKPNKTVTNAYADNNPTANAVGERALEGLPVSRYIYSGNNQCLAQRTSGSIGQS